jgi:predicted DCC family thiol-disulfide oxidoreductase YuxK
VPQQKAILQPSISTDTERKVEAVLSEDNTVMLKLYTWTEDLGWTCQKTIEIEPEMLDDLHRTIAALRYRVNHRKAGQGDTVTDPKVIEFPSFV